MMKRRDRERRVGGIVASSVDGRTWTWSVQQVRYRWCRLGHLEILYQDGCGRINYWRSLDAAIAWTIGYQEGHGRWGGRGTV